MQVICIFQIYKISLKGNAFRKEMIILADSGDGCRSGVGIFYFRCITTS